VSVRGRNGRIEVERTDTEKDPVTGREVEVTEWVPLSWLMTRLPLVQQQALKAVEAGWDYDVECPHSDEAPCDECVGRKNRELAAEFRKAVPWWDQSERGTRARIERDERARKRPS
jgi:hypothetical protein